MVICNIFQVAGLPLRLFGSDFFRRYNNGIGATYWSLLVLWQRHVLNLRVIYSGDSVPPRQSALVIANHQCMTDIPALLDLAYRSQTLTGMKYFVKRELLWIPGFGWGMRMLDFLFVKRSWTEDAAFITRMFARLRTYQTPVWVVNFPEGTRLKPKKLANSQAFARERKLPVLEHVLLPRSRGFRATMEELSDRLDGVYDCTIGFPEGPPSLVRYLRGLVNEVHVHVERFPAHTLPHEAKALEAWLLERYVAKDRLLKKFQDDGRFSRP